ncbi:ATP-binding protein [Thermotalea metallivorans]|uniref:histidine kinase n=1 Tax=Thermotalea metallivorans TaxID=520762 RepID=A0A140L952_9FIRM|nr:ATP-binding protein [Thermotalea metallivorans]KXG77077.1 Blue-light-activated protein [Thermotalea metallivorans]
MRELSLHVLDIVQNSIAAEATFVEIYIEERTKDDVLIIKIMDNGRGMDKEFLKKVTDPFVTTRKTRKVGLGISLFKAAAERCNGCFAIESELNVGTTIEAAFERSHIDRAPLGNMAETMVSLIIAQDQVDYLYKHVLDHKEFVFDTREIRKILGQVPLSQWEVLDWVKNYIQEGLAAIKKDQ